MSGICETTSSHPFSTKRPTDAALSHHNPQTVDVSTGYVADIPRKNQAAPPSSLYTRLPPISLQ